MTENDLLRLTIDKLETERAQLILEMGILRARLHNAEYCQPVQECVADSDPYPTLQ